MRTLPTTLLLMISTYAICYSKAYYPNGKAITITYNTYGQLLDSLGEKQTESEFDKYGMVYFRKLTNKPIFVVTDYPNKIKEIINSYNYKEYLYSYSFWYDLNDMIKDSTLTKKYLFEAFKNPTLKGKNEDSSEYWIYKDFNAKIVFNNDNPISADVINYKSLERNQLAILSYEVTGTDYTIGFNIDLMNLSSKTIKYAYITVTASNPVNDKVGSKIVRGIGPIKPNEGGSYEFSSVIYSSVAKYLSIDGIKIQYMDGTVKIIPKVEIRNITQKNWEAIGNQTIED